MEREDFSFPRINDTCAYNIDSPPLWNLSPAASPNPYKGEENDCLGEKLIAHGQRKSFSCIEIGRKRIELEDDDDDDQEDKMDMLWEDFNEELSSTTGSATSSSREVVEFRSCAQALTVAKTKSKTKSKTKTNALVATKNKHGMVVIVKVLKKLFSITNNNSQGRQRKRVR